MPGGCVVLGDGRIPLYTGRHLLSPGYYFTFTIETLDDTHFPLSRVRDMSFGFGVSRLPPSHRSCERPTYAYEIPGSIVIGYGTHVIDGNKWWKTDWDPAVLEQGDLVGVLVNPEGDVAVFVNGSQVLRVRTSLADDARFDPLPLSPKSPKSPSAGPRRQLYPVVDLHGRVAAVKLAGNGAPPNVMLKTRNRLR